MAEADRLGMVPAYRVDQTPEQRPKVLMGVRGDG
jgi:hypothetical protein